MNRKKRYKQIATGVVLIVALIFGLSQIKLQSVDSYKKEQTKIAKELGVNEDSSGNVSVQEEIPSSDSSEALNSKERQKNFSGQDNQQNKAFGKKAESAKKKSSKKRDISDNSVHPSKKNSEKEKKKNTTADSIKQDSSKDNLVSGSFPEATDRGNDTVPVEATTPIPPQQEVSALPEPTKEPEKELISCTVQILCHNLLDNKEDADATILKYIPSNGILLSETAITVEKGTTAYEALSQICKAKNIVLDAEYTPMYKNYYVKGIGHLYEKQAGDRSGWVYTINGKTTNKGASAFVLSEGDILTWHYTCDGRIS